MHKHRTTIQEYKSIKKRINKLIVQSERAGKLKKPRLIKRIKKFMIRLLEIEKIHKDNGWSHPEAFENKPKTKLEDIKDYKAPIRSLLMPDGSLPPSNKMPLRESPSLSPSSILPNGELAKTPVLPGSDLKTYSDKEVNKFLDKDD